MHHTLQGAVIQRGEMDRASVDVADGLDTKRGREGTAPQGPQPQDNYALLGRMCACTGSRDRRSVFRKVEEVVLRRVDRDVCIPRRKGRESGVHQQQAAM